MGQDAKCAGGFLLSLLLRVLVTLRVIVGKTLELVAHLVASRRHLGPHSRAGNQALYRVQFQKVLPSTVGETILYSTTLRSTSANQEIKLLVCKECSIT